MEHLKREYDKNISVDNGTSAMYYRYSETLRPRVHFSEDVRVYQARHQSWNRSRRVRPRWYSRQEMEAFRLEAEDEAKSIIRAKAPVSVNDTAKPYNLQVAYELYEVGLLVYDADWTFAKDKFQVSRIGLDGLVGNISLGATCPRGKTKTKRLLNRLRELQDVPDTEQRWRLMSQASRCASQASCLGSIQIARWWVTKHSAKLSTLKET